MHDDKKTILFGFIGTSLTLARFNEIITCFIGLITLYFLVHRLVRQIRSRNDSVKIHHTNKRNHKMKMLFGLFALALLPVQSPAMSFFRAHPVYAPQTNYVYVVATNAAGQVVTNTTAHVEYPVSQGFQNTIAEGKQISGFLPPPYDTIAAGVLTLALAGVGTWGKMKANTVNKHESTIDTLSTTLNATIAGVEAVGDSATKASIQSHAAGAGVQDVLHPMVYAVTDKMPDNPIAATAAPTKS